MEKRVLFLILGILMVSVGSLVYADTYGGTKYITANIKRIKGDLNITGNVYWNLTDEITIPTTAFKLPGVNPPLSTIVVGSPIFSFDKAQNESAYSTMHVIPQYKEGTDWDVVFYWAADSDNTGEVVWCINATKMRHNEDPISGSVSMNRCVADSSGRDLDINMTGMVAYWDFQEINSTGNLNDRADENNAQAISFSTVTRGKYGNGISLDGIADYVSVPNSASLNLTDHLTISAWVKGNTDPSNDWYVVSKRTDASGCAYQLYVANTNKARLNINGQVADGSTALVKDTWYMITGTYNGSGYIYVNALFDGGPSAMSMNNIEAPIYIGNNRYLSTPFDGTIDEVGIWNRSLNETEIWDMYQSSSYFNSTVPEQYLLQKTDPIVFDGTGTEEDDMFSFRVYRGADVAEDTYNGDAMLLQATIYYNTEKPGE